MTRKEAIDLLDNLIGMVEDNRNSNYDTALKMAIKALEQEPREGHWISRPHIYGVAFCSECGFELKINNTNYCPNCGADMRADRSEEK